MAATTTPRATGKDARGSAAPLAVSIHHVHKAFRLPHQRYHTLKERALHPYRSNTYDVLQAVAALTPDEVSELAAEFFAPERQTIVSLGPNGAGGGIAT